MDQSNRIISASVNLERLLGVLCIALYMVAINTSSLYHTLRGVFPGIANSGLGAHISGGLCMSVILSVMERKRAAGAPMGNIVRTMIAAVLFAIPLCSFFLPLLPYKESQDLLFNCIVMFFWGMLPPVALYSFVKYSEPSARAFYLGLAMGLGHGYWPLLVTMLNYSEMFPDLAEITWMPLLNVIRCSTALIVAGIAWRLLFCSQVNQVREVRVDHGVAWKSSMWLALLPIIFAFILTGLNDYLFSIRISARVAHPEYAHVISFFLLPMLGLLISVIGESSLKYTIMTSALCLSLSPMLLFLPQESSLYEMMLCLMRISMQVLFFSSMLVFFVLYSYSIKWPILVLFAPWLTTGLSIPASLLEEEIAPYLSIEIGFIMVPVAACCAASAVLVRRIFPLTYAAQDFEAEALPEGLSGESAAALTREFAERHQLSGRQVEILTLLMQGRSTEDMAITLGLRESSVRRYVNALLKKTGVGSRLELVVGLAFKDKADKK